VDDPSAELSEKQAQKIKKYVKDFLDKAVVKYTGHQERKTAVQERQTGKKGKSISTASQDNGTSHTPTDEPPLLRDDDQVADDGVLSDAELSSTPMSQDRKRKRADDEVIDSPGLVPSEARDMKRVKEDRDESMASPPPPPPPPATNSTVDVDSEARQALREQEEALMRENEEAERLEHEANMTKSMETAAEEMKHEIATVKKTAEVLSH
jgi:[histone H3]-lysine36 N-trimethyltransferase